jgi:hypothetical protein
VTKYTRSSYSLLHPGLSVDDIEPGLPGFVVYYDISHRMQVTFKIEPVMVAGVDDNNSISVASEADGSVIVNKSANPWNLPYFVNPKSRTIGFYLGARINPELPAEKLTYIATLLAAALGNSRAMHYLSTRIVDDGRNPIAIEARDRVYVQQPDEFWSVKLYQEISDYLL